MTLKEKLLEFISNHEIYEIYDKEEYEEIQESGGDLSRAVSQTCENPSDVVDTILFIIELDAD